jgi:AcrR family transcriptional regulator
VSPAPRKVTDEDVFAAAYRAMGRVGPSELTLAAIAAEAGVTAGALVQRFGSKRALLLALSRGASGSAGAMLAGLRKRHRSPLAAVRAYGACMGGLAPSPAALARSLAYLQIDLSDEDFRANLLVQARATREGLTALLESAVAAGELRRTTDASMLARTVESVITGALFTWALHQEGSVVAWLRRELDAVLAPHAR